MHLLRSSSLAIDDVGLWCFQVCLAAEECGHLNFSIHHDTWWNSDGFHCGERASGHVPFWSLLLKVRLRRLLSMIPSSVVHHMPEQLLLACRYKSGQTCRPVHSLAQLLLSLPNCMVASLYHYLQQNKMVEVSAWFWLLLNWCAAV